MPLAHMLRHVLILIIPAKTNHTQPLTILRNTDRDYKAENDNDNTTATQVGVLAFAFVKKKDATFA